MRFLGVFRPLVINVCRGFLIGLDTVILNPSIGEYGSRYLFRYRFLVLPLMLCLYSAGSHAARCSISGHYGSLLMACSYSPMMTADMKNDRSEEHTSELQSLMRISYAVFCLTKKISPMSKPFRSKDYSNKEQ